MLKLNLVYSNDFESTLSENLKMRGRYVQPQIMVQFHYLSQNDKKHYNRNI